MWAAADRQVRGSVPIRGAELQKRCMLNGHDFLYRDIAKNFQIPPYFPRMDFLKEPFT
jgi:hypothetical protein